MSRQGDHRLLAEIAALRAAQLGAARQALAIAAGRERDASEAQTRAAMRTDAASAAWHEQIAGGFSPEFARMLGAALVECTAAEARAKARTLEEARAREEAAAVWIFSNSRWEQAEALVSSSRRDLLRDREDRACDDQADRATRNWSVA